jgi:zinc transport system substrate-binding protein
MSKSLLLTALFLFAIALSPLWSQTDPAAPLSVFTSILPQKFFVEQIGGDLVKVEVLVGPGMSPHTYEPLPQQMSSLSRARLFFAIGVPFEKILRHKLLSVCPNLQVIDTDKGITRRLMQTLEEGDGHVHGSDCNHATGEPDPHIWLDPELAIIQGQNIAVALKDALPEHAAAIDARLAAFIASLRELIAELTVALEPVKGETMLVFHPAFGYFADRFALKQKAIEIEGKEPAPRQLVDLIRQCKRENIHIVFVQKQFPASAAETVARSINGSVVIIDPLAEDYIANLRELGAAVAKGLIKK